MSMTTQVCLEEGTRRAEWLPGCHCGHTLTFKCHRKKQEWKSLTLDINQTCQWSLTMISAPGYGKAWGCHVTMKIEHQRSNYVHHTPKPLPPTGNQYLWLHLHSARWNQVSLKANWRCSGSILISIWRSRFQSFMCITVPSIFNFPVTWQPQAL